MRSLSLSLSLIYLSHVLCLDSSFSISPPSSPPLFPLPSSLPVCFSSFPFRKGSTPRDINRTWHQVPVRLGVFSHIKAGQGKPLGGQVSSKQAKPSEAAHDPSVRRFTKVSTTQLEHLYRGPRLDPCRFPDSSVSVSSYESRFVHSVGFLVVFLTPVVLPSFLLSSAGFPPCVFFFEKLSPREGWAPLWHKPVIQKGPSR